MNKYQTEQRNILLEFFEKRIHQTFSAREVLEQLNSDEISISAIYRNLKEMEKQGIICKINKKGRAEVVYQYVHPHSCAGIIHLKCESCENTYHINRHLSHMLTNIADEEFNFKINGASAFLYGTCVNCSAINNHK